MPDQKEWTFKQISTKYNISRPALYKRIRKFNEQQLEKKTGVDFQTKYMKKLGHMWLISYDGVKLITHKKLNSTSPFRPRAVKRVKRNKKIGNVKKVSTYKEWQPTRKYLKDTNEKLRSSNIKLVKAVSQLTNNNHILTNLTSSQHNTITKLRNKLVHNEHQLKLTDNDKNKLTRSLLEYKSKGHSKSFIQWLKNLL